MKFFGIATAGLLLALAANCFGDICIQNLPHRNNKDHYADPSDCHFFYQCFYHNETYAVAIRVKCQRGLFWRDSVLSCMPEGKIPCQDRCMDETVQARGFYAGTGCRQYYRCAHATSYGLCCPEGTRFNEATGGCDEDLSCNDVCIMEAPSVPTSVAPALQISGTVCQDSFGTKITIVSGEENAYILMDGDGNPTEKRFCAETTSFNIATCRCDIESGAMVPTIMQERKALLNMTFDFEVADYSVMRFATFLHDGAERDVSTFAFGGASLRVNGGFVAIPGMKTFDLGRATSMCAFFKCDGASCGNGGIISNYKNDNEFTVVVGTQAVNMFVAQLRFWHPVGTQIIKAKLDIPSNGWNHFCLIYDGTAIRLHLNGRLADKQFVGSYLSLSSFAYEIGRHQVLGSFPGFIDEVMITGFAMTEVEVEAHRTGKLVNFIDPSPLPVAAGKADTPPNVCFCNFGRDNLFKQCFDDGTFDTFFCGNPQRLHCPCNVGFANYQNQCIKDGSFDTFVCF